jgi:signal transduction histidine kinase
VHADSPPPPAGRGAQHSLRFRVALAFAAFGGAVSLALAVAIYLASHDLEERLIDDTLNAELDDYIDRRSRNPHSLPETTATIRAYVVAEEGGTRDVPPAVAALPPGRHWVALEGAPYHAAVRQVGAQRFAVLYNETRLRERERAFVALLAGAVLLMMVTSAVAGNWLAGRVMAPITALMGRVGGLQPEDAPDALEAEFEWDEVRELAHDFDVYLARLRAFIARERLFTGDVSHELRTPLAVISGAAELLEADPELSDRARAKARRIARAVNEMHEITGALLALARERSEGGEVPEPCDLERVLEDVVAKQRELFRAKPVAVAVSVKAHPRVAAERAVVAMVLGNLLRNAFAYTEAGRIEVVLDAGGVRIRDTGQGIDPRELAGVFEPYRRGRASKGAGLGLSLVKRISDRYGWEVHVAPAPGGGTLAELRFAPAGGGI